MLVTVPLSALQAANEDSETILTVKDECVLSDGNRISFGHEAPLPEHLGNIDCIRACL